VINSFIGLCSGSGFFFLLLFLLVTGVHQVNIFGCNSDEVGEESHNDEGFSKEGEDELFLTHLSVVGVIIGSSGSNIDGVSLVDGQVENQLPDSP